MRNYYIQKKTVEYFEDEYNRLANLLKNAPDWITPAEAVQNTLQRCLGVAEFTQPLGLEYGLAENLMEGQRERCYKLINGA